MKKEYTREEAIRLIETVLQKLARKAEEVRERSLEYPPEDEAELYLRTAGTCFAESLKKAKLGSTLGDYDNNTISILLEKCIPVAAEFELERELHEDFVIVEDDIRKMLLGEILNKDVLFSGGYEYLTDAFFSDFYRRTVSQGNYVEGLGYFIDLYEILHRRSESIKTPSLVTPDEYLFKPPAESFYIEVNVLKRIENIVTGIALGSKGDYARVHTPRMFNTTDDDIIVIDTSHLYVEDGNMDTPLEDFRKKQENAPKTLKGPPVPKKGRQRLQQQESYMILKNKTDKINAVGGALILVAQGIGGVASARNLNRLFVSIWTEKRGDCKTDFFTIQIPRCNNLNQEYRYVPVSRSDSDFDEIMKRVRTACARK